MLYNGIKFAHIVSATLLISCMIFCVHLWRIKSASASKLIGFQTGFFIAPLAVIQLLTGFTMLSVNHEDLTQAWVKSSVIFFMIALISWFAFILLLRIDKPTFNFAIYSLIICAGSMLLMIFFMANKI